MVDRKKLSSTHEVDHALKEEWEFKALARRNKLVGLWLADRMGLGDAEAEAYAKEVVRADLEEPGEEDVVRKVMADIRERSLDVSEAELRAEMAHLLKVARGQVEDENA